MNRDYQFEIIYLISLTVATLGFVTTNGIKQFVDTEMAHLMLVLVSLHVILFNLMYTFDNIINFDIHFVTSLREYSRWTLLFVTFFFFYLVIHMAGYVTTLAVFTCDSVSSITVASFSIGVCDLTHFFFRYAAPLVIVGGSMFPLKNWIEAALQLRNINVIIQPEKVMVFSKYEEGEPLFIEVSNSTSNSHTFEIKISLPDDLEGKIGPNDSIYGSFTEETTVDPGYRDTLNMQFRYQGKEKRTDYVTAEVAHDFGSYSKEIQVVLQPQ